MSSKPPAERRPWSVAVRLTLWYASAGFAVVAAATGYLYWGLANALDAEDDGFLADKVAAVRRVRAAHPGDRAAVREQVSLGGRYWLRLTDPAGEVETPGMADLLPPTVFPPAGTANHRLADGRAFRLRVFTDPSAGVTVQAAMNREQDGELLEEYRERLGWTLAVSLFAVTAGGYLIARRGVRPIADVSAAARRIGPTELSERLSTDGLPAEVRELANTFNHMLGRLDEAFARLGRFSADIAHELRTPLGNLRNEAELALGRPRTETEYRDALGSCLEECDRIGRLIDGLLFLARADNPKSELVRVPTDAAEELHAVCDMYRPAAAEVGVNLQVEAGPGLRFPADRSLVRRAVGNLVSNALSHTPAGGSVTLFADHSDDRVRLGVRDTGGGIPAEHVPFVFDRFYRADPSRSAEHGRVGLGLAIVRGIAELHGGEARVQNTSANGTTVVLLLPAG